MQVRLVWWGEVGWFGLLGGVSGWLGEVAPVHGQPPPTSLTSPNVPQPPTGLRTQSARCLPAAGGPAPRQRGAPPARAHAPLDNAPTPRGSRPDNPDGPSAR